MRACLLLDARNHFLSDFLPNFSFLAALVYLPVFSAFCFHAFSWFDPLTLSGCSETRGFLKLYLAHISVSCHQPRMSGDSGTLQHCLQQGFIPLGPTFGVPEVLFVRKPSLYYFPRPEKTNSNHVNN